MRRWGLAILTSIVIIVILILLSLCVIVIFNTTIWPHLSEGSRSSIGSFGFLLVASISIVAALVAIPSSIVQVRQWFDDLDQKQRIVLRQKFARKRLQELRDLDLLEDWEDERFAELEAEVEAEGRRRIFSIIPFLKRTRSGLRREKSLSRALASSQEKRILVEGDPGSGKSVALRHVAEAMAMHASKIRSTKSIIPLYLNLRELERPAGKPIDRNLIKSFVLEVLKRNMDRNVEQFLDDEFEVGIRDGTWFFLFDSFDELPEVLSSTDADSMVKSYGIAINDFLSKMNNCRGIIASRQFHGPKYLNWPRFRVLPLNETRRLELIRRMQLKPPVEHMLIERLDTAHEGIRLMVGNPLFLGLLCKHMKDGNPFPRNAYTVFETYVENRLIREEKRLKEHFHLDATQVRVAAENIAFCMNVEPSLGLNVKRDKLKDAMVRLGIQVPGNLETFLNALEYMKLARREVAIGTTPQTFTFAHRRLQEYFATRVVLRDPSLFNPRMLLTNGRWRETAVTMCQNQSDIQALKPLLNEAENLLRQFCGNVSHLTEDPLQFVKDHKATEQLPVGDYFPWPSQSEHVLKLLQEGFSGRLMELPDSIRLSISKFVLAATKSGILSDEKKALDVAGTVPEPILTYLLRHAFSSTSQWLKEAAYLQTAHLSDISGDIAKGIRNEIVYLSSIGRLHREKHATKAYLARTNQYPYFYSIMRLLLWLPRIDVGLHTALFIMALSAILRIGYPMIEAIPLFAILLISHIGLRLIMSPLRYSFLSFIAALITRCPLVTLLLTGWIIRYFTVSVESYTFFVFVVAAAAYVALFSPFALLAAQTGKFTRPQWWIFMPIWPILYIFTNTIIIISILGTLLGCSAFAGLIYVIGRFSPPASSQPQQPQSPDIAIPVWLILLFLIVFAIIILVIIGTCATWAYRWFHDWIWSNRWSKKYKRPGQMTCQELYKVASRYYYASFYPQTLKTTREQRLLQLTRETEDSLKKIARVAQIRQQITNKVSLASHLNSLGESKECITLVRKADPDTVDELYRLSEDIRTVRQYSAPS